MQVDILAEKNGKKYVIEVVLSTEKTEVEKLTMLSNVDKVIYVCMNRSEAEKLKTEFSKREILSKPAWSICEISEILNCKDLEKV